MKPTPLITKALFAAGLFLLLMEIGLRVFDPLGVLAYRESLRRSHNIYQPHDLFYYAPPDGTHAMGSWTLTVASGHRVTPGTAESNACTIALLGDSFTQGWGVDDHETYGAHLATLMPDVRLLNTGVSGYGIDEVATRWRYTDADGYIYLVMHGDWSIRNDYDTTRNPRPWRFVSAIVTYWRWQQIEEREPTLAEITNYTRTLREMQARDDTLLVFLMAAPVVDGDNVLSIGYNPNFRISFADGHYTSEGNRAIAETIHPAAGELVRRVCG